MNTLPETTTNTTETKAPNKKGDTNMTTVYATIQHISLPYPLQKTYDNFQLYVQNNIIKKSPAYEIENNKPVINRYGKKNYLRNADNTPIYFISDKIQIIWKTTTDEYFITTYNQKKTETVTATLELPGSYGTSFTQTTTEVITHDYLRDYLLKYAATQHPLDLQQKNNKLLDIIIKEKLLIQFKVTKEQNGDYLNTKYYPVYVRLETDNTQLPEPTPEEITE